MRQKASISWTMLTLDVATYLKTSSVATWKDLFVPVFQGLITEQAKAWSAALGLAFDVLDLYALVWFDDYMLEFSNFIMTTTENELNTLLQQGFIEGWTMAETERHIKQLFEQWQTGDLGPDDFNWFTDRLPPYRLEMIARTETMRASNVGGWQLFRHWKAPSKEWLATGDDRTRPSHMLAWATYSRGGTIGPIPIDEPFQVSGKDMMYPLDPAGGSAECIYCRCCILPAGIGEDSP